MIKPSLCYKMFSLCCMMLPDVMPVPDPEILLLLWLLFPSIPIWFIFRLYFCFLYLWLTVCYCGFPSLKRANIPHPCSPCSTVATYPVQLHHGLVWESPIARPCRGQFPLTQHLQAIQLCGLALPQSTVFSLLPSGRRFYSIHSSTDDGGVFRRSSFVLCYSMLIRLFISFIHF